MSILIRDMEMPKNCAECKIVCSVEKAEENPYKGRQPSCPLIEVPKHGRLIDADAFEEYECHHCDGYCDVCECDCLNCKSEHRCIFMQDFKDAPTIIEAEVDDVSIN